jgi:hypothetical protein
MVTDGVPARTTESLVIRWLLCMGRLHGLLLKLDALIIICMLALYASLKTVLDAATLKFDHNSF